MGIWKNLLSGNRDDSEDDLDMNSRRIETNEDEIEELREMRDETPYSDYERENPVFKETVKVTLTPLLTSLTLLNYVEIDSEEEMLGYGIGIILLNVGMYFVAPAVLIISLKKKLQK